MRIGLRTAIVIGVAYGAAACLPVTSTSPVGATVGLGVDHALSGMWKGFARNSGGALYFAFFPQSDGTMSMLLLTPPDARDNGGWSAFAVRTAALGPNRFMNAREISEDGKSAEGRFAEKTIPLLYRLNRDGALVLYLLDETAAANAVNSGKVAGEVEPGQDGDVTLTAAPSDLDAFMRTPSGRALFIKPLVILRRVK